VTIEGIVISAIHGRTTMRFCYAGDEMPERVGHPHALFLNQEGAACVDVFQVAGFSRTATLPAWRTFMLDKILSAEALDAPFTLAPGWDELSDKYSGGIVAMV
jgi:hypothetical protein